MRNFEAYGNVKFDSDQLPAIDTDLNYCINAVFNAFRLFTSFGGKYDKYVDVYVLDSVEPNAFVVEDSGRCCVCVTEGFIITVLELSKLAVKGADSRCLGEDGKRIAQHAYSTKQREALNEMGLSLLEGASSSEKILDIATNILDFVIAHELMHVSLGHLAYLEKNMSQIGMFEFGNQGQKPKEFLVRTAFEVEADTLATAVALGRVMHSNDVEQAMKIWSFSFEIMTNLLWFLANKITSSPATQSVLFADSLIHPHPIKRRFSVEAHVQSPMEHSLAGRGLARNLHSWFSEGRKLAIDAIQGTVLEPSVDEGSIAKMIANNLQPRRSLFSFLKRKSSRDIMHDPSQWIEYQMGLLSSLKDDIERAEMVFFKRLKEN